MRGTRFAHIDQVQDTAGHQTWSSCTAEERLGSWAASISTGSEVIGRFSRSFLFLSISA